MSESTVHLMTNLIRERDMAIDQLEMLTQEICLLRAVVLAAVAETEAEKPNRPFTLREVLPGLREARRAAVAAYLAAKGKSDGAE